VGVSGDKIGSASPEELLQVIDGLSEIAGSDGAGHSIEAGKVQLRDLPGSFPA